MADTRVDTSRLDRLLRELPKQARFAGALALTKLARDGQDAAREQIEDVFDRPVAYTRNAVAIKPANKSVLASQVFVKDRQAEYLAIQETGGERRPAPGKPVIVPVEIRVNASGNIGRGKIKRELAKPTTFVAGKGRRPGIYQRFKRRKLGGGKPPKLLVAFEAKANYKPRFRFKRSVGDAVLRNVNRRWTEAKRQALGSLSRR